MTAPLSQQQIANVVGAIQAARVAKGISQREAARRAGVTAVYLCYVENGKRTPGWDTLERIAVAVGLTLVVKVEAL